MYRVVKRDGTIKDFDINKIINHALRPTNVLDKQVEVEMRFSGVWVLYICEYIYK